MARTKNDQDKDRDGLADGPRQTVRRMPDDQPDVGPYFPSGMGADEAALAGATADMTDEQIEVLERIRNGEEPNEARKELDRKKGD